MVYQVHGMYSKEGMNVELGRFRSYKKAYEFIRTQCDSTVYPLVYILEMRYVGSAPLTMWGFYKQDLFGSIYYKAWFCSCLLSKGENFGYKVLTFNPHSNSEHGERFWENQLWRNPTLTKYLFGN